MKLTATAAKSASRATCGVPFTSGGKKQPQVANTRFTTVQTINLKDQFYAFSLNELRVVQELLSDAVAARRRYRPDIGEKVSFMHGSTILTGIVIYAGKRMGTVLIDNPNKRFRVAYSDMKSVMRVNA
jgi:hypothetical protein